jgi:POT family proton-dependent oligopeptide transporter
MLKFGAGLIISGLGFYVLYAATMHTHALNSIRPIWVCLSFALQALGEILVSALGLSLMAKWAPKALYNALMGGWFVVIAIGSCLSGYLNTHLASVHKGERFMQVAHTYEHSFLFLTLMSIAAGLIVILASKTICRQLNNNS